MLTTGIEAEITREAASSRQLPQDARVEAGIKGPVQPGRWDLIQIAEWLSREQRNTAFFQSGDPGNSLNVPALQNPFAGSGKRDLPLPRDQEIKTSCGEDPAWIGCRFRSAGEESDPRLLLPHLFSNLQAPAAIPDILGKTDQIRLLVENCRCAFRH